MIENSNYTQVPNVILDQMNRLGNSEFKVILAITRQTLGWHERSRQMSISVLEKLTGLSNKTIVAACQKLADRGWITREQIKCVGGYTFEYSLLLDPEKATCVENTQVTCVENTLLACNTCVESTPLTCVESTPLTCVESTHIYKETLLKEKEKETPPPTPSTGWGGDEPIGFDPDFSEARAYRQRSQALTVQPPKPAAIAQRLNQPEWLNGYNAEKPESWAIAHWTPHRERLLHNFATQDLGGDTEKAQQFIRLAIAMLRVEPDYYCRPNRSGYELQTKTLDFLLVPKRNSGIRPVLELAEKAQTLGIDPDAIAQSGLSDDEIQEAKAKHESRDQDAEWAEYERRQQERELASKLELERATRMQMQQRGYWGDTA